MKATELRIGNYLDYDMENVKINSVGRVYLNHKGKNYITHKIRLREYEPIPLTEEWLLKFGFTYGRDDLVYHKEGFNITDNTIIEGDYYLACYDAQFDDWDAMGHAFQYVHQLQNLYFALTGEELESTQIEKI
jgi:hypothetical protein